MQPSSSDSPSSSDDDYYHQHINEFVTVKTLWKYAAEGGKHALFAPVSSTPPEPRHSVKGGRRRRNHQQSQLLRVRKKDLRSSISIMKAMKRKMKPTGIATTRPVPAPQGGDGNNDNNNSNNNSVDYIRHVIAPYLGTQYIDVPIPVHLSWEFLAQLAKQARQSGRIPLSRLKDWEPTASSVCDDVTHDDVDSFSVGMLINDYRSSSIKTDRTEQRRDQQSSSDTNDYDDDGSSYLMTIELKPKAGYLAWTPFVEPSRRHTKYKMSRFKCLQHLHQQGLWTKGWCDATKASKEGTNGQSNSSTSETTTKMSLYDPLDFFAIAAAAAAAAACDNDNEQFRSWHRQLLHRPGADDRQITVIGTTDDSDMMTSKKKIRTAISHLLDTPQNNLRCFVNNINILDNSRSHHNDNNDIDNNNDKSSLLNMLFPDDVINSKTSVVDPYRGEHEDETNRQTHRKSDPTTTTTMKLLLEDIIVQVFTSEDGINLLSRLLSWQKLDILDVDGAVLVYDRLVRILSSSSAMDTTTLNDNSNNDQWFDGHKKVVASADTTKTTTNTTTVDPNRLAQEMLDSITFLDLKKFDLEQQPSSHPLLESSPFHCTSIGSYTSSVFHLCDEIEHFQQSMAKAYPELPSHNIMDTSRQKCLDFVEKLNVEECRHLLLNWLLSLTMCDVSIFVLLKTVTATEEEDGDGDAVEGSKRVIKVLKNGESASVASSSSSCCLSFELRVIDVDQKPSNKINMKRKKEHAFD
jgi:Inositol-pentakisphosphate 2-kinase